MRPLPLTLVLAVLLAGPAAASGALRPGAAGEEGSVVVVEPRGSPAHVGAALGEGVALEAGRADTPLAPRAGAPAPPRVFDGLHGYRLLGGAVEVSLGEAKWWDEEGRRWEGGVDTDRPETWRAGVALDPGALGGHPLRMRLVAQVDGRAVAHEGAPDVPAARAARAEALAWRDVPPPLPDARLRPAPGPARLTPVDGGPAAPHAPAAAPGQPAPAPPVAMRAQSAGRAEAPATTLLHAAAAATGLLLAALVPWALYHRLRGPALLRQRTRERLFALVQARPGLAPAEAARELLLDPTTVGYHLRRLVEEGLVTAEGPARARRYFAAGALPLEERPRAVAARESAPVWALVQARPGLAKTELARAAGMARSSLAWHLARLARAGLVRFERDGREVRVHPGEGAGPGAG